MKQNKGFTLVELSIVIVIIGLIVAGVVGGQTLVKQAKLRSEISQLQSYQVAYNAFFLEYNAAPGDMTNAESYWGAANTDNGDGDGRLEFASGGIDVSLGTYDRELNHVFEHLSLAELINVNFDSSINVNQGFPSSKHNANIGIIMASRYGPNGWPHRCFYEGPYNAMLVLAFGNLSAMPDLNLADQGTNYSPAAASNIDRKIDDDSASGGKFISVNGLGATAGSCHNNGVYEVQNSSGCRPCYYLR